MIGRLLCALGRHAPEPDGLWNAGYCFTRCRRCGRDMVRSAFGEWHVPRDHRIAWHPPGDGRGHQVPGAVAHAPERAPVPRRAPAKPADGDPFDFGEFDARPSDRAERAPGITAAR